MKNYNIDALRGLKYTDQDLQKDLEGIVDIPDNLLNTPDLTPFVINQIHRQASTGLPDIVNPKTGLNYTPEEALEVADTNRADALKMYKTLLNS
jgi:hypothetical protein